MRTCICLAALVLAWSLIGLWKFSPSSVIVLVILFAGAWAGLSGERR